MPRVYNLDVDLLRAFVSVADLGSFTRAADSLLRRQSTLSLQIKRLEGVWESAFSIARLDM